MKDFMYFCIGFSYVKIGIYSERGLVPGIILQIVLIVHYCLSIVLYSLSNGQVWYWRISTFQGI